MTTCARALTVPTLLVRGGLSDVHSEYVKVSEAGHMVAGDRNDVFGQVMLDFLRRVVPVT
ncbi:MAG: pimeloyl-ACP methyl ester carboxylesterase [Burkholderiaceae bacterium]